MSDEMRAIPVPDEPRSLLVLLAELVRLTEEKPDFVYSALSEVDKYGDEFTNCIYVHNGRGSCIVGQAGVNTGLIIAKNMESDCRNIDYGADSLVGDMLNSKALRFPEGAPAKFKDSPLEWVRQLQIAQDGKKPWGEARKWADDQCPLTAAWIREQLA